MKFGTLSLFAKLELSYAQNFGVHGVPLIQILPENGEMKVLFSEYHRRTNLLALLFKIWSPEIRLHTQNFEI
jgi:hypothetical protein